MSELKTLKDLGVGNGGYERAKNDIRQEAIKWIKEDSKLLGDTSLDPMHRTHVIMERWMERFNITDEDLK